MIEKIDLNDATFSALAKCATRIVPLLESANNKADKDMVAILDDLLGAICALVDAHKLGFKGKTSESDYAAILARSKQVSTGDVRRDGNWMAGFHFNSAMFRISAIFDRLPKLLGGGNDKTAYQKAAAAYLKKTGNPWVNKDAHDIREEVNALKHDVGGVFKARGEDMSTALPALDQLLTLAEALT